MVRWLLVAGLMVALAGAAGAADEPATDTPAPTTLPAASGVDPLQLGRDRPPADSLARAVHVSLAEVLNSPDDPWKERRLSLWNAPLGRTDFQMRHPGPAKPWRETIALSVVLPGGPLRFVDKGPLGDWYFNDPDPKTKAQLWTAFAVETALPLIDSLFH